MEVLRPVVRWVNITDNIFESVESLLEFVEFVEASSPDAVGIVNTTRTFM